MVRGIGKSIIVSLLIVIGVASGVSAESNGGIGGRPANSDPANPRTQSIFIYTLDKGQSKIDQVLVSNNSSETKTIELLAVDGVVTNTGAYTCKQNSEEKTGLGAAVALAQQQVTLAPNTNQKVSFTVLMPANADVGEHNACLVFQTPQRDTDKTDGNIRLRTRQAIRLVATVPGDLKRSIDMTNFTVRSDDNQRALALQLRNTGNVSADVDVNVSIKNLFGRSMYSDGGQYPVLANQTLDLSFINTAKPFFGGWYTAGATIVYDDRAGEFGVRDATHTVVRTAQNQILYMAPTPAGALTLAFLALAVVGVAATWLVAKRRRSYEDRTWSSHTVKAGETMESIASSYGVDWKKLSRRNNLKAPFTITSGDMLKVPSNSVQPMQK